MDGQEGRARALSRRRTSDRNIFAQPKEIAAEVRAFGSRVNGPAKSYSDLDLAVVAPTQLNPETLRLLKEAFEESDLPFRVDVLDWNEASPEFQKVIEKAYEVIQAGNQDTLPSP